MKKLLVTFAVVFLFAGWSHSRADTTVKINPLTPLPALQQLADNGDPAACYELAWRYYRATNGCEQDIKKGKEYYEKGAKSDTPTGWACKGYCNESGIGTDLDALKAFEWYKKSAEAGCHIGQFHLGRCYYDGMYSQDVVRPTTYLAQNRVKAVEWYKKSAEGGCSLAQVQLAYALKHGPNFGIDEDVKKAFEWYKKAAEQ